MFTIVYKCASETSPKYEYLYGLPLSQVIIQLGRTPHQGTTGQLCRPSVSGMSKTSVVEIDADDCAIGMPGTRSQIRFSFGTMFLLV